MHYLIDGHNLIGQMPDITLGDPDDEARLVLVLRRWAAIGRNRRVTVIFDGGLPGGEATNLSRGRVRVFFASVNRTADDMLISRVRRAGDPGAFTLVTSDRYVRAAAKARRMPFLKSQEFSQLVRETLETRAREARSRTSVNQKTNRGQLGLDVSQAEDPIISQEEVDEWLALFGPLPEKPTRSDPSPDSRSAAISKSKNTPARRSEKDSLEMLKGGRRRLKSEEVDEWMELFSRSEGD